MAYLQPRTELRTHSVENQSGPLEGLNAFENDIALKEAVRRGRASWAEANLTSLGAKIYDPAWMERAELANRVTPELKRFDRFGRRVDTVEFHPAYHDIIGMAFQHDLHALAARETRPGAHVARSAAELMFAQLECGVLCPIDITYGVIPMLRMHQPDLAEQWVPLMLSQDYDPRPIPHWEKTGVTIAFTSTEKQGGSDIRRNSTFATPVGEPGPGREYLIRGHKWFCSAAGADVIFVVAQAEKGPSCFLVPRWLPDGSRNPIQLERLKEKMGNRSNASTELEFENTHGWMVGEEGRGIPTVMEFMRHTRLGCGFIPAGIMRMALTQSIHHTRHRSAFQRRLVDQPLMRNVLADLAIESEAATTLMMRVAESFDGHAHDPHERAFGRISVAVGKYWINKRVVPFVHECMDTHGGAGYIEESPIARYFRESPLNGIWEGPGNVISLDILRAFRREPELGEAFFAELNRVKGESAPLDAEIRDLAERVRDSELSDLTARHLAERMAIALQASLLLRHAPEAVSEAFLRTRLCREGGTCFGALPADIKFDAILERALPE